MILMGDWGDLYWGAYWMSWFLLGVLGSLIYYIIRES